MLHDIVVVTVWVVLVKQFLDSLRAHFGNEIVLVLLAHIGVLFFGQELLLDKLRVAGVDNDILCEVKHFLQPLLGDLNDLTYTGRGTLEVPYMGHGSGKLNMTHTLAANLCARYFNAAAVAYLALEAYLFVFSAVTFPVLGRSKDPFAEKTVALRLLGSVVYGLRSFHNAVRPGSDLFGGRQTDFYRFKGIEFQI